MAEAAGHSLMNKCFWEYAVILFDHSKTFEKLIIFGNYENKLHFQQMTFLRFNVKNSEKNDFYLKNRGLKNKYTVMESVFCVLKKFSLHKKVK